MRPTQGEIRCAVDPAAAGGDFAIWNGARKCHDPHAGGATGCCYEVWYKGNKSLYVDASARQLTPLSAIANFLTTAVVLEDKFKEVVGWMRWATEVGAMTNLDQRNFFGLNAGTGTSLANGISYGLGQLYHYDMHCPGCSAAAGTGTSGPAGTGASEQVERGAWYPGLNTGAHSRGGYYGSLVHESVHQWSAGAVPLWMKGPDLAHSYSAFADQFMSIMMGASFSGLPVHTAWNLRFEERRLMWRYLANAGLDSNALWNKEGAQQCGHDIARNLCSTGLNRTLGCAMGGVYSCDGSFPGVLETWDQPNTQAGILYALARLYGPDNIHKLHQRVEKRRYGYRSWSANCDTGG